MADEKDETTTQEQQPQQQQTTEVQQLTDKHGEPAISKGRYEREMQTKDAEIAALKDQLKELSEQASAGAKAQADVDALRQQLADEKVTHSLEVAGCVNAKAAKALLGDYDGDVAKLKEDCPYLFKAPQTGSTGLKPGGAPGADLDAKLDRAFGIKRK